MRRASAIARATVAQALLAAAFTAQLCSVVHLGLVRHEVCEEHGEIVDRDVSNAGTHDEQPLPETGDHHEHCPLLVPSALPKGPMLIDVVDRVTFITAVEPWRRDAREPSLSVLHVAPKTSPPLFG